MPIQVNLDVQLAIRKMKLGELTEARQTTLDELMCVCSNCHFAIHNGDTDANQYAYQHTH